MIVLREELAELELCDKKEINNLKNTERVNNEEDQKPHRLAAACGVPKRETLPDQRPEYEQDKKRQERGKHSRRPERHIDKMLCTAPLLVIHSSSIALSSVIFR